MRVFSSKQKNHKFRDTSKASGIFISIKQYAIFLNNQKVIYFGMPPLFVNTSEFKYLPVCVSRKTK